MINEDFYEKLKKSLESDYLTELLLSMGDLNSDVRRLFLVKVIHFLISTRDFDGFEGFLNRYYREVFPYEYIKEKTGLPGLKIESMLYDNFIKNGFLFHVTPNYNLAEILEHGLKTLNDKYQCDLYKKCLDLNEMYSKIRDRNLNESTEYFKSPTLINIPGGIEQYLEDRFKTVYLSSNLDYILKTYGESGELFDFFIRDLLWVFKNCDDVSMLTKEELKNKVISVIKNSSTEIFDEEITLILDFFDTIYEKNGIITNYTKAIIMVPTQSIESNFTYFDSMYKDNKLNLPLDVIVDFHHGEVGCSHSISPDNIIAIETNDDRSLSLKRKR